MSLPSINQVLTVGRDITAIEREDIIHLRFVATQLYLSHCARRRQNVEWMPKVFSKKNVAILLIHRIYSDE